MKESELLKRIDHLLKQSDTTLAKIESTSYGNRFVPRPDYLAFRSASLSLIQVMYGTGHPYFTAFQHNVKDQSEASIKIGVSLLGAIKDEVVNGWLITIKSLVTGEVFADFLEMSEHLLAEGYKDAAAVMIGSTLEEHLRQLCKKYEVETTFKKGDDNVAKKADVLNAELKKAEVYGLIEQKLVTAWLGIRNSAAHGNYDDYSKAQVEGMYTGVLGFISQTK